MPLIEYVQIYPTETLGLWDLQESVEELLCLSGIDEQILLGKNMKSVQRQKEWLTSRYLVHQLTDGQYPILYAKDEHGKPYLPNSSSYISVSHSKDKLAVVHSPYAIGVDVQHHTDKMLRVARKFVSEDEFAYIPDAVALPSYHVLWGAKEAMYKAYGKKGVIFKRDMFVAPFEWQESVFYTKGWLDMSPIKMYFDIRVEYRGNYYLIIAKENYREVF